MQIVVAQVVVDLVVTSRYGDERLVAELLRRFANPDSYDPVKGRTALQAACKHKHPRVVKMLIQAGADVELIMSDGICLITEILTDYLRSH